MTSKGRLGFLVCAAVLVVAPLGARAETCSPANKACAYVIDRQGAYGNIDTATAGSYAFFDIYGENFRAGIVEPPTVSNSPRGYGCVKFVLQGQAQEPVCGNFTVTISEPLSKAVITGTAQSAGYTVLVNVTVTATPMKAPEPKPHAMATCTPGVPVPSPPPVSPSPPAPPQVSPRACIAATNPAVEREGTTSGSITLKVGPTTIATATAGPSTPGWIYAEALGEADVFTP